MASEEASPHAELVPARMVNEFAYCPRLMYLEWVDGDFADNSDTVEGRFVHRRVDEARGTLPEPGTEGESDISARSLTMSDPASGLIARMDVVEMQDSSVVPVDFKRGEPPDNAERSWEPERLQLCVQAIILRSHGYKCSHGLLYYAASKQRVEVPITDELVGRTLSLVQQLRIAAAAPLPPAPLVDGPKCPRCSLVGICLPDEMTRSGTDVSPVSRQNVRLLYPERPDASPLYVTEQGARVGRSGERIVVRSSNTVLADMRLLDVAQVNLFGNVQISTQALQELVQREVPVLFFSHGGYFYGIAHGMPARTVRVRAEQFDVAKNPDRALPLARAVVRTKILNQRTMLRRNAKELPAHVVPHLRRLAVAALRAGSSEALLGIEGAAANLYFEHFHRMLTGDVATFDFRERNRRPPRDAVNAMLSLGYAILTKDVTVACLAAGVDPYVGVFHHPGRGRPALALDVMEEFRPLVVDSVVINLVNRGGVGVGDFIVRAGAVALRPDARRHFIEAYERRMEDLVTHPVFGYRISYRRALEVQVRLMARAITRELPRYLGFLTR